MRNHQYIITVTATNGKRYELFVNADDQEQAIKFASKRKISYQVAGEFHVGVSEIHHVRMYY